MRVLLSLTALACFCLAGIAQDKTSPAELEFLKNGPRLYDMPKAQALTEDTGKPTLCWMGPHLFARDAARELSKSLGETTIQSAMDKDGEEGKIDPRTGKPIPVYRVKFSATNYRGETKTAYVSLEDFAKPGTAERILKFCRGEK